MDVTTYDDPTATKRERIKLTKEGHFWLDEAECKCGKCEMSPEVRQKVDTTAPLLELVRHAIGVPLVVSSWVRCEAHNQKEGGARFSRHLFGDGVDLISIYDAPFGAGICRGLMSVGRMPPGGIGLYRDKPNMWHVDFRGRYAFWIKERAGR